jgi:hypothetical protein
LQVGRDYHSPAISDSAEFRQFETTLTDTYPDRFANQPGDPVWPAINVYAFSLIEACIAQLAQHEQPFDASSAIVEQCILQLVERLDAVEHQVACGRFIAHLTTADGSVADVGDMRIIPVRNSWEAAKQFEKVIPGAAGAFNGNPPFHHDPPLAVIVATGSGCDPLPTGGQLSKSIDRFLLLTRLLTAGTTHDVYEVVGETSMVRFVQPRLTVFDYHDVSLFGRTTTLSPDDGPVIAGLDRLLDGLVTERPDMVVTSFQMALLKFTESHRPGPWYKQLVDLSTALEAALSGQDKDDVSLRMRSRAAALLAGPDDHAAAIFDDIGKLYGLRSTLVHGSSLKASVSLKTLRSLSTANSNEPDGVVTAVGVARLRDLVRRSLLARIGLAVAEEPLWPLEGQAPGIDRILVDDEQRARWRSSWRTALESIGAGRALRRASDGHNILSGKAIQPNGIADVKLTTH